MSDEKTAITKRENNVITIMEGKKYSSTNECNKGLVSGRIETEFEFDHNVYWEKFYRTRIIVERLSGTKDYVPLIVSNLLLEKAKMLKNGVVKESTGKFIEVAGQFRSHNEQGHLKLYLFATAIKIYEEYEDVEGYANLIWLDGYICKSPVYRKTPLGREITDFLIAVNRQYNKSDYIPCIAWGRTAAWAGVELKIGDRVQLYARMQSREYFKRYSDSEAGELRVAYELSILRIKLQQDLRLED